jgi:hypothetical protein
MLRNPRLVDDTSDVDPGQGTQARRVKMALYRLRARGLVLHEHKPSSQLP